MLQPKYLTASGIALPAGRWRGFILTSGIDACIWKIRNGSLITDPVIAVLACTAANTTVSREFKDGVGVNGIYAELVSGTTPNLTLFYG